MEQTAGERNGSRLRVGERLAAERATQGIALADIAQRTRIPLRSLETIEAGGSEGLPALTYTAGFVRSYASALGLDGTEYSRQFRAEMGRVPAPALPEAYELADPSRVPSRLLAIVALVVALLVAGGYAIWRGDGLFGGGAEQRAKLAAGTEVPPPNAVTPEPAPLTTGGAVPPQATPLQAAPLQAAPLRAAPLMPQPGAGAVAITAREPVWVKIYERDGATLYMGTMASGQRFEVPAGAIDPLIRTGRAQALTVTAGGTAMAPLGPPDALVKDRSLKPAALSAAPLAVAGTGAAPGAAPR